MPMQIGTPSTLIIREPTIAIQLKQNGRRIQVATEHAMWDPTAVPPAGVPVRIEDDMLVVMDIDVSSQHRSRGNLT